MNTWFVAVWLSVLSALIIGVPIMGMLAEAWEKIKQKDAAKDAQVDQLVQQNAQLSQELEASNANGLDEADKAALAEMKQKAGL